MERIFLPARSPCVFLGQGSRAVLSPTLSDGLLARPHAPRCFLRVQPYRAYQLSMVFKLVPSMSSSTHETLAARGLHEVICSIDAFGTVLVACEELRSHTSTGDDGTLSLPFWLVMQLFIAANISNLSSATRFRGVRTLTKRAVHRSQG